VIPAQVIVYDYTMQEVVGVMLCALRFFVRRSIACDNRVP
jgi:hypothetical protein